MRDPGDPGDGASGEACLPVGGYGCRPYTFDGRTRDVYVRGSGPAVVVMHEIAGLTAGSLALGARLAERGFTVFLPLLFGRPDPRPSALGLAARSVQLCISREWNVLAGHLSTPVADWVRALCREAHAECGGPGVGAIGMCLTGGFVIPLLLDPPLLAPVTCQPALPLAFTSRRKRSLGVSVDTLARAKLRSEQGVSLLGLRFTGDRICPPERFDALRAEFGPRFEDREIPSEPGNAFGIPPNAHSVLTRDYVDAPGHPTRDAFERVVQFLTEKLKG